MQETITKRFDPSSIKSRILERLRVDSQWSILTNDGAIDSLITAESEALAEAVRYGESLFLEKKWESAVNMSSLTHQGNLIGRKIRRPVSAIGYILISHTDIEGVNRLNNLGSYFFNINAPSDFDDILRIGHEGDLSLTRSLIPWINSDVYTVPKGARAITDGGVEFLSTQSVTSRVLTEKWSSIVANDNKLSNFYKAGGWNGIKYLKVPVIQGKIKTVEFGPAARTRFETFRLNVANVEDASNSISADYLKFIITLSNDRQELWTLVPDVKLCGPYDKVFEANTGNDGTFTLLRVGDGITGALLPENCQVTVQYLETMGEEGNILQKYSVNKLIFPDGYPMIDPRTGRPSDFLSCINNVPILGGKNIENEEDYKTNAPISYLRSFNVSTLNSYEAFIKKNSPVSFLHLKLFAGLSTSEKTIDTFEESNTLYKDHVAKEFLCVKNTLFVSAIGTDGEAIPNAEESFIKPLSDSLKRQKSPFDTFAYKEPNFIDLKANITVSTKDLTISDTEIAETIELAVDNIYGHVNTSFEQPIYSSKIIEYCKLFPFAETVSLTLEAKAKTFYDKDHVNLYTTKRGEEIVAIPFKFDKIYGINAYKKGFRNYKQRSPYLLKIDLEFINNSAASPKNRTFFLFDERYKNSEASLVSINEAKAYSYSGSISEYDFINESLYGKITFYDETKESFEGRCCRIAQYEYLKNILNEDFISKLKNHSSSPYENRPYYINEFGKNILYQASEVTADLQVVPEGGSGSVVYKANKNFIGPLDITFLENYDNYEDEDFASGALLIPLSYLGFSQYLSRITSTTEKLVMLEILLESFIRVNVFALPQIEDIQPSGPNDFISLKDNSVRVEVKRMI